MKTITTVEQLEALPVGSICARFHDDGSGPSVYVLDRDAGWLVATEPIVSPNVGSKDLVGNSIGELKQLHPLIFDAEDVERAAEALHKRMHLGESLRSSTSGYRESVRGQARAALGAVGEAGNA